ncbi:MAG: hypothetical protein R3327_03035 [Nitrosopumilaceae archaeon]|nr:hypothetical protein [Nitrosopumilaceae archaeon]
MKSRTITMTVNKKTGDVFDAILNVPPKIMPDAKKNEDGWWSFTAQRGPAKLKFKENRQLGILDHVFIDQEAKWDVPMRVVSSGETSEIIVTLVKPNNLTDKQFDERAIEVENMMNTMKEIIENSRFNI